MKPMILELTAHVLLTKRVNNSREEKKSLYFSRRIYLFIN
jgi:hypothetical protein